MMVYVPTRQPVENSQVKYDENYKWTLEEGIEDWIKRDLGVEE